MIFTTGGLVIWQKQYLDSNDITVNDSVVNSLVSDVFIENRTSNEPSTSTFYKDSYTIKYRVSNDLGLIFISMYKSLLQLTYIDQLMSNIQKLFTSIYSDIIKNNIKLGLSPLSTLELDKFDALVDVRVSELEKRQDKSSRQETAIDEIIEEKVEITTPEIGVERPDTPETPEKLANEARRSRRGKKPKNTTSLDSPSASGSEAKAKIKKKAMRRWGEDGAVEEDSGDQVLDYSASTDQAVDSYNTNEIVGDLKNYGSANKSGDFVLKELSSELHDILGMEEDEEKEEKESAFKPKPSSGTFGFLRNIVGGKTLSPEDLQKALTATREQLMKKNVANEVADHLCSIVDKSLVGSKTQSWTSVESTVKVSMTEALKRILTPSTSLDLLHEIQSNTKHSNHRPYVISVVGVNGVGKSTNLSKLGFWLLQNKFKILIAACDTFRSGAVEQLKVHVNRLQELTSRIGSGQVEIFDQGYGKDAAVIAQKAIEFGQRNGFDVVLIDTAGRRHNDDRLMASLEKFGKLAAPDKVIMVGEALVGTDSVQQARNFNAAFGPSRNLDFFLISKCDTVGDMIGTIVNMTYSTGIPVLFVGIGQNYTDLRTLSVEWAVNLLMS